VRRIQVPPPADAARIESFRRSIDTVAALPCDVLTALHPSFGEGKTCRAFADAARARLDARLTDERRGSVIR
jgi:metallo-beta-lactamase class B